MQATLRDIGTPLRGPLRPRSWPLQPVQRPTCAYICCIVKAAQMDWTMTFHSSQHSNGLREARARPNSPPPSGLCNAPTASCVSAAPQTLRSTRASTGGQLWRTACEGGPLCSPVHHWPLGTLVLSYPTAELQDEPTFTNKF